MKTSTCVIITGILSLGASTVLHAVDPEVMKMINKMQAEREADRKENAEKIRKLEALWSKIPDNVKKEAQKQVQKELNSLTKTSLARSQKGVGGGSDEATRAAETAKEKDLDTLMATEPAFLALGLSGTNAPELTTPRKFAAGLVSGADKNGKFKQGVAFSTNLGLAYDYIKDSLEKSTDKKDGENNTRKSRSVPAYESHNNGHFWVQNIFMDPGHARTEFKNWWTRELYRSNLSFATARGTDKDDKSLRLSVGLSAVLYDHYDPYAIFHNEGDNQELSRVLAELGMYKSDKNPNGYAETPKVLTDAVRLAILNKINSTRWVRSGVQVGFAPAWFGADSKLQNLSYEGYTAYLSLTGVTQFWLDWKHGVPKTRETKLASGRWQEDDNVDPKTGEKGLHKVLDDKANLLALTAHVRYRTGEQFTNTGTGMNGREDTLFAAGRLTFGSRDINAAAEGGYLKVWNGPNGNEDAWHIGGAISTRVAKNVYFVISTGQTYGAQNEYFATGSFRFGTSDTNGLIPMSAK